MSGKTSGLGDNLYVGGYDLSGDIGAVDGISSPIRTIDVTGIKKFAHERILTTRDGDMQFTSFFNAAGAHVPLSALPVTDVVCSYFRGTTLLNPTACINAKQVGYNPTRDTSANLTLKVDMMGNKFGLEWGVMLTAGLRTDGSASTSAFIDDFGAGTTFGGQAYLQLTALTGTNVDVTITHCTTSGGAYTTLMDFGSLVGVGAVRQSVANNVTVNRFLKVASAGTFSAATFSVGWTRNQSAVVF